MNRRISLLNSEIDARLRRVNRRPLEAIRRYRKLLRQAVAVVRFVPGRQSLKVETLSFTSNRSGLPVQIWGGLWCVYVAHDERDILLV